MTTLATLQAQIMQLQARVNAMVGVRSVVMDSDFSVLNGSSTAMANLCKVYTIPANDASPGTIYRLRVFGFGTEGSTSQDVITQLVSQGQVYGANQYHLSGIIPASAAFCWQVDAHLAFVTTGTSAQTRGWHRATFQSATQTAASTSALTGVNQYINAAVDSTIDRPLGYQASWTSTAGGPVITGYMSYLERIGP